VAGHAHTQHSDDNVSESPRDRGKWRRLRFRKCPVNGELPSSRYDGRRALTAPTHAPAAGDRLAEVLGVAQARQSWPKLVSPVPVQLLDKLMVPIDGHSARLRRHQISKRAVVALAKLRNVPSISLPTSSARVLD
jgi:hypothetical protein